MGQNAYDPAEHQYTNTWPSFSYTYPPYPRHQLGWECPGCGRCYSPSIAVCFYCGGKRDTFTVTYSNVPLYGTDSPPENT